MKIKRIINISLIIIVVILNINHIFANGILYNNKKLELTSEEQNYLDSNPTVIFAGDKTWRPLEYEEDGQYKGVIREILNRIEDSTGLKFEYKIMDDYNKTLEAMNNGEVDIISGVAYDKKVADGLNVELSNPYLSINSAVVSKDDSSLYTDNNKKVAVVKGDYANDEIANDLENVELIECLSNQDCLDRVKAGKVDMALIASYCAEYYSSVPKYSNLKVHTVSDFSWQLSFGISRSANPYLISIFNKGINAVDHFDINEAIYNGLINAEYDNELMLFIYKHPLVVISSISIVLITFIVLLSVIYIFRKKEHLRKIEDGLRFKLALERTNLCIWELDLKTKKITQIDNSQERHGFYDITDNIPESVIEKGYVHPEDCNEVRKVIEKVFAGNQNVQGCWRIKDITKDTGDSVYWWEQVLFRVIYDERNNPIKVIGVSEDVTKEKEAQKDSLTLVYNRNSFEQKANHVLKERRNAYLECAYLILDLDGFKTINDTYGHDMGDKVLISVGSVLNNTFRSSDIVGRLGGDEFTVFMTSISKKEDAIRKAKELVENICMIQTKENFPFPISCSIGVVVSTKGKEDLTVLYKKADEALYQAKREGKNCFKLYEK